MSNKPQGPVVFDLGSKAEKTERKKSIPKADPAEPKAARGPTVAPSVEPIDPSSAPMIIDDAPAPKGEAMVAATRLAARPISWVSKLFWGAIVALLVMYLSTAAWDFATMLIERNLWLGRTAILLAAVAIFCLLVIALRELMGFASLSRLDGFRQKAEALRTQPNDKETQRFAKNLSNIYRTRADMKWARENLEKGQDGIIDPVDLLDLTEAELMAPLDKAARREIEASARQVAGTTAIVPLALADVFVALTANTRMVRRIAEIYGGRSGAIGSLRLLRAVATHLIATGAVGVADDMIGSVAGGGLAAKLSRRFGEGIINGALTARVGLAAMDVCRPMPFAARKRPGVTSIVQTALTGLFGREG